jgi:hypothetical protein
MANGLTCGQGLAEQSMLPARLGELIASVSEILELHTKALDLRDENSKREYEVYLDLARRHQKAATQLQAIARQMAGYRDLPMGRHDPEAMSAPEVAGAFEQFVSVEQELLALLQSRVQQNRHTLTEMREPNPAAKRYRS